MTSGVELRRALAVMALGAGFAASGCSPSATPPKEEAAAPAGTMVYVSNETKGTVVLVDAATGAVAREIPVGKRPRGIKLSHDGSRLFVALSGSPIAGPGVDESKLPPPDRSADGIGVVDLAKGALVRTYPSGQDPETFDISPDGRMLYVSNEETAEMSVVDLERGEVTKRVAICGEPEGVTVSPDGRTVYVTCEADNAIAAIDTRSYVMLGRIPTAARPRAIAVTGDGATLYVTCETAATISIIDAATRAPKGKIELTLKENTGMPPRPMGAVLSADGSRLYVSTGRAGAVAVIDTATNSPTRMIQNVGTRPWGIALSPDGRSLYTANGPSGDVSFIDIAGGTVERRVRVDGSPWGVAVGPRQ